jgi:hypothetical protein
MEIGWGTSNLEKPRERQVFTPCACGGAVGRRLAGIEFPVHSVCVWRGLDDEPLRIGEGRSLRVRVEEPFDHEGGEEAGQSLLPTCVEK